MKTNTQALDHAPSQSLVDTTFRPLLSRKNEVISQLLGCEVRNSHAISFILVSLFLLLAFIFATDSVALYGWTAFFALSAVCVAYTGLREIIKIVED